MRTGETVRITTPSKGIDPNLYEVVSSTGFIANLRVIGDGSKKIVKVNKKRIVEMPNVATETTTATTTKVTKTKTVPQYDFASKMEEMGSGSAHYVKNLDKFPNANAQSHVIVNGDHTRFFAINTYNGSAGRLGKADGRYYDIKEGGWDKKLAKMTRDGYESV